MINHLDRYLLELGANELLLQIIIVSEYRELWAVGFNGGLGLQDANRMCEFLH